MALVLWLCGALVNAAPVSESAALQRAQAFLSGRGRVCVLETASRAPMQGSHETEAPQAYHIFNVAEQGGFVIVSGDDRAVPVLGYSDSGFLDSEHLPAGLQDLLNSYAEEIAILAADTTPQVQAPTAIRAVKKIRRPILPMIETHWGQSDAYNLCTPIGQGSSGPEHALTGCVATGMAQLMYYHRWPSTTTKTIPGYYSKDMCLNLDSLPVTTFDYDSMLPAYNSQSDSSAMMAVSKLMQYCGYAIQMDYGLNGSSATTSKMPRTLLNYFDYDSTVLYVERLYYDYDGWIELLYNELRNGRPVGYSGKRIGGGHMFICDGYDADDYFHFNFGWKGDSDGYYSLSALNPFRTNGDTRYDDGGYCSRHAAVIGVRPNTGESPILAPLQLTEFTFNDEGTHSKVVQRNSVEEDFPGTRYLFKVYSMLTDTAEFEYIAKVIDNETGEWADTIIFSTAPDLLPTLKGRTWRMTRSMGEGLVRGTYQIRFQGRVHGTQEWKDCLYSDQFYLTAEVDSLTMTLHAERTKHVNPNLVDINSYGPHTVGLEDTVVVRIVATAGDCRTENLCVSRQEDGDFYDVSAQHAYVLMGDTATIQFTYKPSKAGNDTLAVFDWATQIVPTDSLAPDLLVVAIADDPNKPIGDDTELTASAEIYNLSNNTLYGNGLRSAFTFVNQSPDNAVRLYLFCVIYRWTQNNSGQWSSRRIETLEETLIIPKRTGEEADTIVVPMDIEGIASQPDGFYSFRYVYFKYLNEWVQHDLVELGLEDNHGVIRIEGGYNLGDATGHGTLVPDGDTIRCGNACFVDLRTKVLTGTVIEPSNNPNCLYLLNSQAPVPAELTGLNVVVNDTADSIILHDSHDFFCPISLLAHSIQMSREISTPMPSHDGWNTLVLPFEPSEIPEKLRLFVPDYDEPLYLFIKEETTIQPYKPYFAFMEHDSTATIQQNVRFAASEYVLTPTPDEMVWDGDLYSVGATCRRQEIEGAMVLRPEKDFFTKPREKATVEPFGVWIKGITRFADMAGSVTLKTATPTGTEEVQADPQTTSDDNAWYTLTGIRLGAAPTQPGAYIHQHRVEIVR